MLKSGVFHLFYIGFTLEGLGNKMSHAKYLPYNIFIIYPERFYRMQALQAYIYPNHVATP